MENLEVPAIATPKNLTNNKVENQGKGSDREEGYDGEDFIEDETPNHDANRKMAEIQ